MLYIEIPISLTVIWFLTIRKGIYLFMFYIVRLNTGIVASNPAGGMDGFPHFFSLYVCVLCR
jgi:hypothetical protein